MTSLMPTPLTEGIQLVQHDEEFESVPLLLVPVGEWMLVLMGLLGTDGMDSDALLRFLSTEFGEAQWFVCFDGVGEFRYER